MKIAKAVYCGLGAGLWVVLWIGLALALVVPVFPEIGLQGMTTAGFVARLLGNVGVVVPANPVVVAALGAATAAGAGAVFALLVRGLNPAHGGDVGPALRWAWLGMAPHRAGVVVLIVAVYGAVALLPEDAVGRPGVWLSALALLVGLCLLPFCCLRPELVRSHCPGPWYRPRVPGVKPLVLAACLCILSPLDIHASALLDWSIVGIVLGVLAFLGRQILVLAAVAAFLFRMTPGGLVVAVRRSASGRVLRAWLDLRLRLFLLVFILATPALVAVAVNAFVIPSLEASRNGDLPLSFEVAAAVARTVRDPGNQGVFLLVLTAYCLLAEGRLLARLNQRGSLRLGQSQRHDGLRDGAWDASVPVI